MKKFKLICIKCGAGAEFDYVWVETCGDGCCSDALANIVCPSCGEKEYNTNL
jgi:hypothetical protein